MKLAKIYAHETAKTILNYKNTDAVSSYIFLWFLFYKMWIEWIIITSRLMLHNKTQAKSE